MALVILQGKVQPEVLEQFRKAQEESEAATFNQFIEIILEKYLNPKVKNIEVIKLPAETVQQIENLNNEIGRLKIDIDFKNETIQKQEEILKNLGETVSNFQNNPPAPGLTLEANQVLIDLPPVIAMVIDKEMEIANRRAKTPFTRAAILMNCFWETIVDGRYIPFKIWSGSELSQAAKQLKAAQELQESQMSQ